MSLYLNLSKYDLQYDFSDIVEGLEDIIELGNTPIKWSPVFENDLNLTSFGFRNLSDITSVTLDNGLELTFHEISKEIENIFYDSGKNYSLNKNIDFKKFEIFHFVRATSPTIEKTYDEQLNKISFKYFINGDYEGGEWYFPEFDETIKPNANELYVFPSTKEYRYIEKPITRGTRYQVVAWQ